MTEKQIDDMQAVDVREIAAEELCKNLLESLLLQIKQMRRPWQEMTQVEQEDVIESLRRNVLTATGSAVRLIASNGAISVVGTLDQVTIKEGVKAQITIPKDSENLTELFDAVSNSVMIVCAGNAIYTKGVDEIHGEEDQANMFECGAEYDENRTLEDEKALGYEK